jgi:hypothetical protein
MSGKRIRGTLRALRRLDEIGAYVQKDNPEAAARVVAPDRVGRRYIGGLARSRARRSHQGHA